MPSHSAVDAELWDHMALDAVDILDLFLLYDVAHIFLALLFRQTTSMYPSFWNNWHLELMNQQCFTECPSFQAVGMFPLEIGVETSWFPSVLVMPYSGVV